MSSSTREMCHKAKVVMIITSDESLIQLCTSNEQNSPSTQVFDLRNDGQKLAFLTRVDIGQVSNVLIDSGKKEATVKTASGKEDLLHRKETALNSHLKQQQRRKRRKAAHDTMCVVCGAEAIGFNYDALTCGSCKIFFWRNADEPSKIHRCVQGDGKCPMSKIKICPACRLKGCFNMGMKKECFLKTKAVKKESLCSSHITLASSVSPSKEKGLHDMPHTVALTMEDWLKLQSLQLSFTSLNDNCQQTIATDFEDNTTLAFSWPNRANTHVTRLIAFCRQTEEFEHLTNEDRFTLIKYNMLNLLPVYTCLYLATYRADIDVEKVRDGYRDSLGVDGIHEDFIALLHSLFRATERDPVLLHLLIAIILFSKGMSAIGQEPPLMDPMAVNRAQEHYVRLTWNYLTEKYGSIQTASRFTQLFYQILCIQKLTQKAHFYLQKKHWTPQTVEQISPLVQAVLHISP